VPCSCVSYNYNYQYWDIDSDSTKIRRLIITATFICYITFNLIHCIQSFNVNWGTNFPAVQLNKTMQIVIVSILSDFSFFLFLQKTLMKNKIDVC
jgi:hypothetical protein